MAEKNEKEKAVNEQIRDFGQVELEHGEDRISMLTIIGEIEGHECLPAATKTTKYEHVLPKLAEVEENKNVDGLLLLLNTVGGDVESGLAIAELVAVTLCAVFMRKCHRDILLPMEAGQKTAAAV